MNKYWIAGLAILSFSTGWLVQSWRLNEKIAELQATRSNEIAVQSQDALKDLKEASANINAAALGAKSDNTTLTNQIAALRKDIKNAKPLPPDCKPDDVRMRNLAGAISATNKAVVGSVSSQ